MYYKIGERIEKFEVKNFDKIDFQYIAVIGSDEWIKTNKNSTWVSSGISIWMR